ncbi:probable F-box protein At3g61730 [Morus notabilis]|uniref:probable F-box protein At3g61730 n=1 Tax=Morus notabilis TaxID=981085 RepID=UPI000CED1855|nr:probable F-box protein At3g61730 [Morus notabilis]
MVNRKRTSRVEATGDDQMAKRKRNLASMPQRTRRPLRRSKTICSCSSPASFLTAHSTFCWYERDLWTEIAKFLDARSLVMLAATSRWFQSLIMEDSIWKYVCLRDLQVPTPCNVSSKWIKLYASAFDGSHSFMFRQQEKHIDWMRIGAFSLDSSEVLLTERLSAPTRIPKEDETETMLQSSGCCVLKNVKTGIWIADLQLVRCPVCDLNTCDGTMQTLDARHIELFLSEGYQNGSWDYDVVGSHDIKKHTDGASGAVFDVKHLKDSSTSAIFNLKSWVGKPMDWQPRAVISLHAVAVNTNLQKNEGIHVKYHAMRAGPNGEIVSIRISQQLL